MWKNLRKVLSKPTKNFLNKKPFLYKDNGANILAVGHLDSVQPYTHTRFLKLPGELRVYSPVLDDRLGVYVITEVLPKMGLNYDILLTDNEEVGDSTAQLFTTEKEYNWIFEFDRKGNDAVIYQYDDPEWEEAIKPFFKLGFGSYSDIADLEHLGCCGINVGVCYEDYHSKLAYANLTELEKQIDKFVAFFKQYEHIRFKYIPEIHYGFGWHDNYCEFCQELVPKKELSVYYGYQICDECYQAIIQKEKENSDVPYYGYDKRHYGETPSNARKYSPYRRW